MLRLRIQAFEEENPAAAAAWAAKLAQLKQNCKKINPNNIWKQILFRNNPMDTNIIQKELFRI
jgi:phosphopantetheinyl transferase (holo-ACP synthase)